MFAVIKTGGKQYRVAPEDVLTIDRIVGELGDIIQLDSILAVGEGDDVTLGSPIIEGATVAVEVIEQGRGPKVIAFKKRRRKSSRRKRGHRQLLTTVRISEILLDGAKPSKKATGKPAKPAKAAPAQLFTAPQGEAEDLTKIKGIGPVAAKQLSEQGLTTFAQLAALSDEDVERIDAAMPFSADQIKDWREQAKEFAK